MAVVIKEWNLLEEGKPFKEVRKYPILFDKSCRGYMEKDANCLSAKKCHEPKIVFSFYVVLFLVLCCLLFRK